MNTRVVISSAFAEAAPAYMPAPLGAARLCYALPNKLLLGPLLSLPPPLSPPRRPPRRDLRYSGSVSACLERVSSYAPWDTLYSRVCGEVHHAHESD